MSLSASPKTANTVQARLKELYKCIKQIEDARKGSEGTLLSITTTHKRIESDDKLTSSNKSKLISLCEDAVKDAEKEEDCSFHSGPRCFHTLGLVSARLAAYPRWVLDYVIVHELAHLVEASHGPAFWELVNRYPLAERARGYLIAKGEADE